MESSKVQSNKVRVYEAFSSIDVFFQTEFGSCKGDSSPPWWWVQLSLGPIGLALFKKDKRPENENKAFISSLLVLLSTHNTCYSFSISIWWTQKSLIANSSGKEKQCSIFVCSFTWNIFWIFVYTLKGWWVRVTMMSPHQASCIEKVYHRTM